MQITPYIWGSGLEGEVAPREGIPSTDIHASFTDVLKNTDFALMLLMGVRKRRFGVLADLPYLSVEGDDATPGPFFGDAELESETLVGALDFAYRAIERDSNDGFVWDVELSGPLAGLSFRF